VFAALAFAFSIQFSAHFIFFIAAFYIFVFLPGLFIGKREVEEGNDKIGAKAKIINALKISLILIAITFALNANWIIGGVAGTSSLGSS